MKTEKFQRKPFIVDGVQVTTENMEQVAKWCNGTITHTDPQIAAQLNKPIETWIHVETQQPMNDRQKQAFVGDWVLYAGRGFKIYTQAGFERTFEPVFKDGERPAPKIHGEGNGVTRKTRSSNHHAKEQTVKPPETIEGIEFTHNHKGDVCANICPVFQAKLMVLQSKGPQAPVASA